MDSAVSLIYPLGPIAVLVDQIDFTGYRETNLFLGDFVSQFQISALPNGVRVVTCKRPIHTTTVAIFANVGARNESEAENGLSHFLEHMAFKGTPTRDAKEIAVTVERQGSQINAFTSRNTTCYFVTGLPQNAITSLDILSDVLQNSLFSAEEIAREQEVVCQEIAESQDDISDIAMTALTETAFPNQSWGRPILGPEENVRGFDTAALNAYVAKHYHANSILVTAVGDVDHDTFLAEVEARFSGLASAPTAEVEPVVYEGGLNVYTDDRFDQAQVFLAFPAPGIEDTDHARFDVLSDVLGGGMSAPLFQEVREKRGLCYSVGSGLLPQQQTSLFIIRGSTTPKNLSEFIEVSAQQIARIAAGDVDAGEFERALNTTRFQIAAREEKSLSLARSAASDLYLYGRIRSTEEVLADYEAVTLESVIEAAKELLATKPTVIVAGNADENFDYQALVNKGLGV